MANEKKKMVEAITAQEVDFAQWYTDICTKAELVEYSSVKGFVVLRPYGYAIWENIQKNLDARFKATGHENVAMPVLMQSGSLASEVLIFALAAMGCNLLLGFTGLLSFGQGIFFGLGSYTVALMLTRWPVPMPLALLLATLMGLFGEYP